MSGFCALARRRNVAAFIIYYCKKDTVICVGGYLLSQLLQVAIAVYVVYQQANRLPYALEIDPTRDVTDVGVQYRIRMTNVGTQQFTGIIVDLGTNDVQKKPFLEPGESVLFSIQNLKPTPLASRLGQTKELWWKATIDRQLKYWVYLVRQIIIIEKMYMVLIDSVQSLFQKRCNAIQMEKAARNIDRTLCGWQARRRT